MTKESEYKLRKRIKDLEQKLSKAENDLHLYRLATVEIYDGVLEQVKKNEGICRAWILGRIRKCLK